MREQYPTLNRRVLHPAGVTCIALYQSGLRGVVLVDRGEVHASDSR